MADTTTIPTISGTVDQKFLIEPLNAPKDVIYYLQRFPEEIYTKSPDTHLYKFMRSLLGESGVNWIRRNQLEARLLLEEYGIDLFDVDRFFGSPFKFGRIVEEEFDDDPLGLLTHDQWDVLRAKSARYRNRAIDYINGARAGNTPFGMRLVAKAGLGHDVDIVENYKYLYDVHSDDPLGLDYFGQTTSTEEMIVLPRREVGASEVQVIRIYGDPDFPNTGGFSLIYNGIDSAQYTYNYDDGTGPVTLNQVPYNGTRDHVRLALESIFNSTIYQSGEGRVQVSGGPGPMVPWVISFMGPLANRDVPELQINSNMTNGTSNISVLVTTLIGGEESSGEIATIPARAQYSLQLAVDRIRPQTTVMTLADARGLRRRNNWLGVHASSEYSEVLRYVTGTNEITWPDPSSASWIETQVEKEGPRVYKDLQYHYTGFHNITNATASSSSFNGTIDLSAKRSLADYTEPLLVTQSKELRDLTLASYINGIYPIENTTLPGAPTLQYNDHYWASAARTDDEWIAYDFDFIHAVNYVSFDINKVNVQIDIDFDIRDTDLPHWYNVNPIYPFPNVISASPDDVNPWASIGLTFSNAKNQLVYTRSLKLRLTRLQSYSGPIQIRNFRAGRNVS